MAHWPDALATRHSATAPRWPATPRRGAATSAATRAHRAVRACAAQQGGHAVTLAQRDAAARFLETTRAPDGQLLADAFAVHLLGGEDSARLLATCVGDASADMVVARCLDAALVNATRSGGVRQVVVVGHGADTRAFRLDWPAGVCIFELGPHDALAHAELAFHSAGLRPNKTLLLRRVPAEVSGAAASCEGWAGRLLAAGLIPDRQTAWALQGLHLLPPEPLTALLLEVGGVAATGSTLTGELCTEEAAARTLLAECGFLLDAYAPLSEVAASLGRAAPPEAATRALFSATKTRLTGVQHERMQDELFRAEVETGEEGFADAP